LSVIRYTLRLNNPSAANALSMIGASNEVVFRRI
jgi:hypothetical protein